MTVVAAPVWRQVAARLVRHEDRGAEHRWLEIEIADPAFETPRPGQFVQLLLGAKATAALLPRPMSVAAARKRSGRTTLGFLYAAVGLGTRSLAGLAPGGMIEVLGPLGRPYPLERPGTPVLLAGGRGVAPLLFAAESLARQRRRAEFVFGARDRARLIGVEEACDRIARLGGRLHLCTDDGSRGFRGDVVACLAQVSRGWPRPLVLHACGPHAMLAAAAKWAVAHGAEAWLAMESVMACGTGVCRGCPLPRSAEGRAAFRDDAPSLLGNREYAMCCTEGPVFEARELDWGRIH
jgi:dihydroorotate dehydrogenase electron transfer subunit